MLNEAKVDQPGDLTNYRGESVTEDSMTALQECSFCKSSLLRIGTTDFFKDSRILQLWHAREVAMGCRVPSFSSLVVDEEVGMAR